MWNPWNALFFLGVWASVGAAWGGSGAEPLGPGDKIQLIAPSHRSLNTARKLDARGQLRLPFAGDIKLSGLTPRAAAALLKKKLGLYFRGLTQIEIRVLERSKYVWIRGWVKRPGRYLLQGKDSIDVLIRKAQGIKPGARLDRLWFHTPGHRPKRFDLLKYYQRGKSLQVPPLRRNTIVFVPVGRNQAPELGVGQSRPGRNRIAVVGAVKNPGVFPCFWKLNLLQALAMAGGPLARSGIQEVLITPPQGKTSWFDLKAYLGSAKAKESLPQLKSGTVVFVPFRPLGRSKRGPVRVLGQVGKPGVWRGSVEKDLPAWLARSGGPTSQADLNNVSVVYRGRNFTIHQQVDVGKALAQGKLRRLPPTPAGKLLIFVPSRRSKSRQVQDLQTTLQIAISITSVVSSVVLLALTLTR